jgi:hypothetical protein
VLLDEPAVQISGLSSTPPQVQGMTGRFRWAVDCVLEQVEPVRLASELDEVTERRGGTDGQDVDIGRRPRKAVKDCDDEPAQTVQVDAATQACIHIVKEAALGLSKLRRHTAASPRASR